MTEEKDDDDGVLEDADSPDDDEKDDFLRGVAHVEDRPPPLGIGTARRLEPGATVGRFRVLSEIDRGGMGIVFLAEDDALRRKVALKVLRASFAADEERRRRFLREARAAAGVSHPNLVTVYDVGEHEGRAYIAMEYLRGKSLRSVLASRDSLMPVEEATDVARQVLRGLVHAHENGLLHRDLKPENVLVGDDGRVRLVDFGLAKIEDAATEAEPEGTHVHTTKDGLIMGTPGYMSPEQARGQAVDERSDVFSFGVLFFELLTFRRPFVGPSKADIVTSLLRDEAPHAVDLRPEVGARLSSILDRCLAKSPDDRWPSSRALANALDAHAERDAKSDSQITPPAFAEADTAITRRKPPPTAPPRARMSTRLKGAITVLALGLGIAVVVGVSRGRTGTPARPSADAGPSNSALAITDLPPPKSNSAEALTAYRQAMQAFRDADWAIAQERLNEAIAKDPEMSAAYLHLVVILGGGDDPPSQVRSAFSRAMATRANLSERDQGLLLALEPIINRDPTDHDLATKRFKELLAAHPNDAELWHLYAVFCTFGKEDGVAAERRAVELDPQFADAWQILGSELAARGNVNEALAAIDRCLAISPLTADCRGERARLYARLGQCSRMEEDLRKGLSSNPRAANIWHEDRAAALLALGRSDDTILEAFRQKWALYDADRRKKTEAYDRALLAIARGRLAEADVLLADGEKAIELDPNVQVHSRYTWLRVKIALEMSRPKDAAKMAASFRERKDVWLGAGRSVLEIPMLRVMSQGDLVSPAELAKARDAWFTRTLETDKSMPPIFFWMPAYADYVETPAEAAVALRALPVYEESQIGKDVTIFASIGHILLLAGKPHEAIAPLAKATTACNWLEWPIAHTKALVDLGQAREADGDRDGACDAYTRVLARWATTDKSITRDLARTRARALQCETRTKTAPSASASKKTKRRPPREEDEDDVDEGPIDEPPPPPPPPPPPR